MPLKSSLQKKVPSAFGAYHFLWAYTGAQIHKHPSEKIFVIGITGTKGKTTTLELLNRILEAAGKKTALLSSLRKKIGDDSQKNPTGNSMPGRGYIQQFLKEARRAHCGYALIEVTSQGVVAHRHRFIHWNVGAITNLHPEHIESHGSFENYRNAKLSFLKYVSKEGGKVFLNHDDQHFDFFAAALAEGGEKTLTYTRSDEKIAEHLTRIKRAKEREGEFAPPKFLLNKFNEENVAAAIAIAKDIGITDKVIEESIEHFEGVPGRMEFAGEGRFTAIVDYAHTPDSLEAAYRSAREQLKGDGARLIGVLGAAGGGRDTWKRPEFGKIAAHYCDEIILTDEDPYDENPEAIIDAVATGIGQVPYPRPSFTKILDRREALAKAIEMMHEGDVVIATGKGSEDWIHRAGGKKEPWNEKEIVQGLLSAKE